jgi:hypothetical protein
MIVKEQGYAESGEADTFAVESKFLKLFLSAVAERLLHITLPG